MDIINSTPIKNGFRMPGEFEPHKGCWMAWPEREDNWYNHAKPAQKAFTEVAIAISKFEPVKMCVSKAQFKKARATLPKEVELVEMAYDDAWMRDIGPTFVIDGIEVRGIDWEFISWGGYFPSWELDNRVAEKILIIEKLKRYKCNLVLEGGSIHTDGEGTLITTEKCLLNPNRNTTLSKKEVEEILKEYLNVSKVIWFKRGIYTDDEANHVDNLCCFIKPGVVALTWTDDKNDPQYVISLEAFEALRNSMDAIGRKFEIYKIHQPDPLYYTENECKSLKPIKGEYPCFPGKRLSASYINFYIANGGIILPGFGDPKYDHKALKDIQNLFPKRKVIQVLARDILLGGGCIHCITQQQPSSK